MADINGYELARPLAERLHALSGGHPETSVVLGDGALVMIRHAGFAALSYQVRPTAPEGQRPAWIVAATDYEDPSQEPFIYVGQGEKVWTASSGPVPEWAFPLLGKFISVERTPEG